MDVDHEELSARTLPDQAHRDATAHRRRHAELVGEAVGRAKWVSSAFIRQLEEYSDTRPMPGELMEILRNTFSDAGIEFLFPLAGKSEIRLR
ncbi:hypothetical protein [Bradyrhizobium sp. USDA 10063]